MSADETVNPGEITKDNEMNSKKEDKSTMPGSNEADGDGDGLEKRLKLMRVDEVWDKKTRKNRLVKTAKFKNKPEKLSRYVITKVRLITIQGAYVGRYRVEIRGRYLNQILHEIYKDTDMIPQASILTLDEEETKLLFHAKDKLEGLLNAALSDSKPNATLIFELEAVQEFIQENFGSLMAELEGYSKMHMSFKHVWTLFPPHVLAHSQDLLGQSQVGRVNYAKYVQNSDGSVLFLLNMSYLDSDGKVVGWQSMNATIKQFPNTMFIHDLPVEPLHLRGDYSELSKTLAQRGDILLRLHGRHLQEYKGHGLDEEMKRFNSHGRVMLDPATMYTVKPRNDLVPRIFRPIAAKDIKDLEKMLLRPILYGFSLGDKVWGAFALSGLSDVIWDDTIIDSLVLATEKKQLVRALVRTHGLEDGGDRDHEDEEGKGERGVESDTFDDFVRDKGKGLVGLLAGPPGVGKTLTAEAVAEIAHRPLYTVSSGELGDSTSGLQQSLSAIFELAEIWKAVVLLDEADVFLACRSLENLTRNAITSIFLRHLEYYQGILLLTTNRIHSLDPAFQSRIHFCLQYTDLDITARFTIWKSFVSKMQTSQTATISLTDNDLTVLAEKELNGRQIKNCMSVARATAIENQKPITLPHVLMAIEFSYDAWIQAKETKDII